MRIQKIKVKILFFLEKKIAEEQFKREFGEDFFETNASKKLLSLLEHNYNVNNLYQLFQNLDENFQKILDNREILFTSLLSTLISCPDSMPDEIDLLIKKYCEQCKEKIKKKKFLILNLAQIFIQVFLKFPIIIQKMMEQSKMNLSMH